MFMDNLIQRITSDLVIKYKKDKNVFGVMLFGSAARGGFDKYSDVDIYILLGKKKKISRENFINGNLRVDIIFNSLEEANSYLRKDKLNIRRYTSHMLAFGKIIYQKDNHLSKIQLMAQKNLSFKTKFSKGEILMHKYSIDDFWGEVQRDVEKEDYFAFGLDSQLLLNNIIELFLKIKGDFLRRPNEMGKAILKLNKKFFGMINDFYKSKELIAKKGILSKLVKFILEKTGGDLPQKWNLNS
ncbi:MAG: hypothetical protein Athens071426_490 [Parcubacteria group bacterium Athens0714_26]|nr:MAG: hypothetical protein Athens101426_377 [Parcubacteria group bacterium Athens1014_26]TSD02474.1 MAG: hypothetical protein Athens071426_490 [Parcubacteria group bacterium Athens0714_26]